MKHLTSVVFISILASLLVSVGCKSQQNTTDTTTQTETKTSSDNSGSENQLDQGMAVPAAKLLASIKRTPCYGRCPMYQLEIMDNGEVVYQGKRFVEKIGTYSGLLAEADIKTLHQRINDVDYFNLEEAYDVPIADFPTCITSVHLEGRSKTIMDKQGAPEKLKQFELYLDSLLEGLELTKLSDEVSY